ncbi:DNA/RNA nuclease SfsA [Entomomonas sp. E2T0]|uniref:DNA/RNA nuclease SfsA n=1 Tax=Entomomonas sp. E2T0 TaxID=2930213 RepID=UPI0022281612|nr:DNA/RNA nuclease SfsA [Entomomonas sp. E2T0]UYZ84079.1 DNA/RNA nuclease SfsA [Entomomonas sp. E2T0]
MQFDPPLEEAILIKRYKRFLADIKTATGEILTIHCPNTGSMLNCMSEGCRIWFSRSTDPKRKSAGSWTLSETPQGRLACVNTHLANKLVEEALQRGVIKELLGFNQLRREVKYGQENSRIDFCLDYPNKTTTYLEVKSVTLGYDNSDIAAFPDAVTSRGSKHLRELAELAKQGTNTVLLYCVNLTNISAVRACKEIDANYAKTLQLAHQAGVKILAYSCNITPQEIAVTKSIEVILDS